jgi:hypothetical protein
VAELIQLRVARKFLQRVTPAEIERLTTLQQFIEDFVAVRR